MDKQEILEEFKKIREEIEDREKKLRSKLSYLLSRIQETSDSTKPKGDLFERD
jgi:hypothetical protein